MRSHRSVKLTAYLIVAMIIAPLCFIIFGYLWQFIAVQVGFRASMRGVSFPIILEYWIVWGIYGLLFSWVFLVAKRRVVAFAVAGLLGLSLPMIVNDLMMVVLGSSVFRIFAMGASQWLATGVVAGLLALFVLNKLNLNWEAARVQTDHAATS